MSPQRLAIKILLFLIPFLAWVFLCRDFILDRRPLLSDALAYYEHIKCYLGNIRHGIYPLWDPWGNWDQWGAWGGPNDFFLRRFCEFNPFVYLPLLWNQLGLPYDMAYRIYLIVYFGVGLAGFYLLARKVFTDERLAWIAYLLLLFSTLGTTSFFSYLILLFVPFTWFFYFLLCFTEKPQRHTFLGLTFTLMIILNTYLPFYFLTILLSFFLCFLIFYPKNLKDIFCRSRMFVRQNTLFSLLIISVLLVSSVPGVQLFLEMKNSGFVLPSRHGFDNLSPVANALNLNLSRVQTGGLVWFIVAKHLFADLQEIRPLTLYIPFLAFLILAMGSFARVNRRLVFLSIWGLGIFLLALADATPIHKFCYEHIFFFHYFRNLQHFLWVFLLPMFILVVTEFLRLMLLNPPAHRKERIVRIVQVLIVHMAAGLLIFNHRQEILGSTFAWLALSAAFFLRYYAGTCKNNALFLSLIVLLIIPQSCEVYNYLTKNAPSERARLPYNPPFQKFVLFEKTATAAEISLLLKSKVGFYISSPHSFWLNEKLNAATLITYRRYKLRIYDEVKPLEEKDENIPLIAQAFWLNTNIAFIPKTQANLINPTELLALSPSAQLIEPGTKDVEVISFNANNLRLKTHFDRMRFLVYNDAYYDDWNVFLDGRKVPLFRANIAFKGVLVPGGDHVVHFRYGQPLNYLFRYFLIGLFWVVFLLVIKLSWNSWKEPPSDAIIPLL